MLRDIFFVVMVLSISIYVHSNKNEIINFIEVYEEEEEYSQYFLAVLND